MHAFPRPDLILENVNRSQRTGGLHLTPDENGLICDKSDLQIISKAGHRLNATRIPRR